MGKRVDHEKQEIAWFPDRRAYHVVKHDFHSADVNGEEHGFTVAEIGDKVQWVDDAPDDREDGAGHFEVADD